MDLICVLISEIINYENYEFQNHLCWGTEKGSLEVLKNVEFVFQKQKLQTTKSEGLLRSECVLVFGMQERRQVPESLHIQLKSKIGH